MNWKEIYSKKTAEQYNLAKTQLMIDFSGFKGKLGPKSYLEFIEKEKTDIEGSHGIFEIGCGCGMFLNKFYTNDRIIGGVDFSKELIDIARAEMPWGVFVNQPIEEMVFHNVEYYDTYLAFSVFQYLSKETAERIIREMMVNPFIGKIFIYDIPDRDKKDHDIYFRESKGYPKSDHTYYDKYFFSEILEDYRGDIMKVKIEDQDIRGYENNPFRFNVKIWK